MTRGWGELLFVLFIKYYEGDYIKEDLMDGESRTRGKDEKFIRSTGRKT